ncbi:hypothetical protein ALC53_10492 [Atta colombica]|uniref:Uncharacterized protein n=1 Tax=Atta colombica TaxID=520822 RepID=A0A195B368_9HYME|nr:hypothetical protein ALC53_10492 [Atta colombica]
MRPNRQQQFNCGELSTQILSIHTECLSFYTDGSKNPESVVGAGVFSPEMNVLDAVQDTGKAHRNYIFYFCCTPNIKQIYYEAISKGERLSCSKRYHTTSRRIWFHEVSFSRKAIVLMNRLRSNHQS